MSVALIILGTVTVGGAIAAMSLRNIVHCLLWLVVSFVGLAGLYLSLSATFVGLTQVLVYLGAVAILLMFAILLTRGGVMLRAPLGGGGSWILGPGIALLVLGGIVGAVVWVPAGSAGPVQDPAVRRIGELLLTDYVVPLQGIALLLTGALIGAVVLALPHKEEPRPDTPAEAPSGAATGRAEDPTREGSA